MQDLNSVLLANDGTVVLLAYAAGSIGSLLSLRNASLGRFVSIGFGVAGGLAQVLISLTMILDGNSASWSIPSGVPLLDMAMRLDPLSAIFTLALGVIAIAVSIYSFGYTSALTASGSAILGFFFNLQLLSLSVVFTASNAAFFLVPWE